MGFRYGTSSSSLTQTIQYYYYSGTSSSFSADLTGLADGTTYYVQAYVVLSGQTFTGEMVSFTTESAPSVKPAVDADWLELPAAVSNSNYLVNTYYAGSESDANRNYTHCYDKSTYTSLWTAYHLNSSHMGSLKRPENWSYSPSIEEKYQANLKNLSYAGDTYSRGHMIPNASRNGNEEMQKQTFYVTNSVPQIQNTFNGSIWASLEGALQSIGESEEVYIVTGVCFNKVGESRSISYVYAQDKSSDGEVKKCPVPNYFYKVVLKVNKSGNNVTASAVGFWFEHKDYEKGDDYSKYSVSVDQIEQWTGFDFFVNLPDDVEATAETNSNWTAFQNF